MIISVTGSGGKTTFIEKLASKLKDKRVLITTSTKIKIPQNREYEVYTSLDNFKRCYSARPGIYAVCDEVKDGKFIDIGYEKLNSIIKLFDHVLIEADGSKNKPLKAWRSFEPVIYPFTDLTIGVLPCDLLGRSYDRNLIFNVELFEDDYEVNDIIDENLYCQIANDPKGLFKNSTRRIIYLSRSDFLSEKDVQKIKRKLEIYSGIKVISDVDELFT